MKKSSLFLCIAIIICTLFPVDSAFYSVKAVNADIIVAKDGTGKYKTIQEAVNAAVSGNTIYIKNGIYQEVVDISKDNIKLIGESNTGTVVTYGNYAGKLKSDGTTYGTSGSASFYIKSKNVTLENIAIENSFDENTNTDGKQAVALYVKGDKNTFINCVFTANQDTLYANAGRQYYYNCKIVGDTDFIFGAAIAVFDRCDIISTVRGGYVTAASTDISTYGFLFDNCKLTSEAKSGSTYLGRPWRQDAYVVYKNCYMGAHIRENPWTSMSGNVPENARFYEYKSTGPGGYINSYRRQLSDSEAKNHTPINYLKGTDGWNPTNLSVETTTTTTTTTTTVTTQSPKLDGDLIRSLKINDYKNASKWSIQQNLQIGNSVFGDRAFLFTSVPGILQGSEWIRTSCDSKLYTLDLATFTLNGDATVYIGLDSRVVNVPAWLGSWTKAPLTLTDDGNPNVTYILYQRDYSAGSEVILGTNGGLSSVVNYTVVVKPQVKETITTTITTEQTTTSTSIKENYGDLNGDTKINNSDLVSLSQHLVGDSILSGKAYEMADITKDGLVDVADLALMKQYLMGDNIAF